MAEKELRPKSFRIDDETAEKFKEIAQKIGGNQQETLSRLIEAFELQAGKTVLAEQKAEVEQFERYMMAATRMYMSSLEANQLMAASVRTEFDAQLKSKDAVILDLQSQLAVSKEKQTNAEIIAETLTSENARLNEVIQSLETDTDIKLQDAQQMLDEKDKLNESLSELCWQIKSQLTNAQEVANQSKQLAEEVFQLKQELAIVQQEKELEILENQKVMLDLQNQYLAQVSEYQEKYKQLLEQLEGEKRQTNKPRKTPKAKQET